MLKFCTKCSHRTTCRSICPKLEEHLKKHFPVRVEKYPKEIAQSQFSGSNGSENIFDNLLIKRSPLKDLEPDLLLEREFKILKEHIRFIRKPVQRERLQRFLRCDSITKIAQLSNTTKQNIHKQLWRIFRKISKRMTSKKDVRIYTPYKIKKRYSDLRA